MNATANELETEALRLVDLGYSVFPLSPNSKIPFKGSHGHLDATTDVERIERWWGQHPNSNIGIATAGLLVVDVDLLDKKTAPRPNIWLSTEPDKASELAAAPTFTSQSGGRQHIFRQPDGQHYKCQIGKLAPGIDIKADDGYCCFPPSSVLKAGKRGYYKWIVDLDVPPHDLPLPPAWLWEQLLEIVRGDSHKQNGNGSIPEFITDGKRNDTLARMLAIPMARKGASVDSIYAALKTENALRCQPPMEPEELLEIAQGAVERYWTAPGVEVELKPTTPAAGNGQLTAPVLIDLGTIQPKPIVWLWPGRVASGNLTTVAGAPGLGKSQATLDMIARVTTGHAWPDQIQIASRGPGSAILISAEDDLETVVVPRLIAAGADRSKVVALQGVEFKADKKRRGFTLADMEALEQAIVSRPDCKLVVVDPVTAFLGKVDSHKDAELRGVLAPLADLAARTGVAVVNVQHLNKASGMAAINRVSGSGAFVAAARAAWLVAPDRENRGRRLFVPLKNNLAKDNGGLAFTIIEADGGTCVQWESGVVTTSADEALREDRKPQTREGEKAWLAKLLADGPQTQEDIRTKAESAGFRWRTIRRALEDLQAESFRSGFGRGGRWSWRLHPPDASKGGHEITSTIKVATFGEDEF